MSVVPFLRPHGRSLTMRKFESDARHNNGTHGIKQWSSREQATMARSVRSVTLEFNGVSPSGCCSGARRGTGDTPSALGKEVTGGGVSSSQTSR